MIIKSARALLLCSLPALGLTACHRMREMAARETQRVVIAVPSTLNDANIAAILLASNNTDISYARLAPARAQNDDVRKFAQHMLVDHAALNTLATDLLSKINLSPEDNTTSLDLRDESAARRDEMRPLTGFAFDSSYVANEVRYHRRFLATMDQLMVPNAHNRDLRTLLTNIRPALVAHLSQAEELRDKIIVAK